MALSSRPQVALPQALSAPCEQHVCVEAPALVTSEAGAAVHLNLVQQALILALIDWPAPESLPNWLSDPPPFRNSSLVSLHTVLRV